MSMPDPDQRMADLDRMILDYPARVAELTEQVAAVADRKVSGQDSGDLVTVTCTAQGRIESVTVSGRALRDLDNHSIAERIVEAANDALTRAEQLLTAAVGGPPKPGDTDQQMAAFESRMDDMLYELDRATRRLDQLGE
jgi:DNA-binding protein YbaB